MEIKTILLLCIHIYIHTHTLINEPERHTYHVQKFITLLNEKNIFSILNS